jgi:hypothetical protein
MRRWFSILLVVIASASALWLGVHIRNVRLKRQREIHYRQVLGSYTAELSPGVTRERVEEELHARGAQYEHVSGFDRTNAYAVLVKIGTEPAPWYCSKNNIYIKFSFDATDPKLGRMSDADSDILQSITVTPWLQDCL